MGWFSNKKEVNNNSLNAPGLPELKNYPNIAPILPNKNQMENYNPEVITTPYQRKTFEISDTSNKPIFNEPKPGMKKSMFSITDGENVPEYQENNEPIQNFENSNMLPPLPEVQKEEIPIKNIQPYIEPKELKELPKDNNYQIKEPINNKEPLPSYIPQKPAFNKEIELRENKYPEPKENYRIPREIIKPKEKNSESIFIRLDKFQLTMEAFREIKSKIREIEELLLRTREIKAREEKELEEWEREINSIKMRLDSIDREISNP